MGASKYPKYLEADMKFNKLTVIEVDEESKLDKNGKKVFPSEWKYKCKCSCTSGKITSPSKWALTSGYTKSCGCLTIEKCVERNTKENKVEDCGDYFKLYKRNSDIFCTFDKEDYDKVKAQCWGIDGKGYFQCIQRGGHKDNVVHILLHRFLVNAPDDKIVDHKDGNKHNNRKENLRITTLSENGMNKVIQSNNTSGTTGVYWNAKRKNWCAQIKKDKHTQHLGSFKNKEDAIKARKGAEEKYFGEFSYDNSRGIDE